MMEVVFHAQDAGVLRCARSDAPMLKESDIFCLELGLAAGDISGDCLGTARRRSYAALCRPFPEEQAHCISVLERTSRELELLLDRAGKGEPLRIWYSMYPHSLCGLCWLLWQLKEKVGELPSVSVVKLPDSVRRGQTILSYRGWGEMEPAEMAGFCSWAKELIPASVTAAAGTWMALRQENAPLRAVINGSLQSVGEDFYDRIIFRELDAMGEEFQEADLIGRVLALGSTGMGDLWISGRIGVLVREGKLLPITKARPGEPVYRRTLRKAY